jgi:serine/threonine-protein kinase RsbW
VLNGRTAEEIPFPRNDDLIREGQVRLDFLVPSKLSRILGVNRLLSFLATEFGFPPEESKVNLPLVMDEALSNAITHGNKGREDLKVHVRIYVSSRRILIQIEDQGGGFMPDEKPDPTGGDNLFKDSGRGIYLIRELMDNVSFAKGGRVIEMEKHNSATAEQAEG